MADIRPEFDSPRTGGRPQVSGEIAAAFTKVLDFLDEHLSNSRERSIVVTKLQEAHFFAQIAPHK